MPDALSAYLPQDRRRALARGRELPDRTAGAAIFADVTGFTPLAEALSHALGPRRGAEELTALLNEVYHALIIEVDRFGGSVVGFSGDAITCWFDGDNGRCALACGLAMREAMAAFAAVPTPSGTTGALAVKVACAAGPIRRFLIGDPQIQVLEILAGRTLDRLAAAAHLAAGDDVMVDAQTLAQIGAPLRVAAWREDSKTGIRAAAVTELSIEHEALGEINSDNAQFTMLDAQLLRPWLLPAVYARLLGSPDPFLAELRPVVALMLQFGGLDYDWDDSAGASLDAYIRQVQAVVTRYEGILIDVTMADKGGYLFAAFGAPMAHEDDAFRAVRAARELPVMPGGDAVCIGISQGMMRTGPYGSTTRRAYGVLGDEVNLACRLMSHAASGEVLVSSRFQQAVAEVFLWAALPTVRVKGKREPVAVYRLQLAAPTPPILLSKAAKPTEMIGRARERAILSDSLDALQRGACRAVVIEGEPGIGKSRLIAETARLIHARGLVALTSAGQSIEQTSYRTWRDVFTSYFDLAQVADLSELQARVQAQIAEAAPALIERLPLLNDLLNLGFPDTDCTRSLDAAQRSEDLDELLVELLRAWASVKPLILVFEDAHWLDSRSWGLMTQVAHTMEIQQLPLLLVVALRSLAATHPAIPHLITLLQLPDTQRLVLSALPADEIVFVAATRLGVTSGDLPDEIADLVRARAGGNPFFAEELVAALRDEGLIRTEAGHSPAGRQRWVISGDLRQASMTLPNTLHGLILSRIDRLPPEERLTLKVASVIGPTFAYPLLHSIRTRQATVDDQALKNQLRTLATLDFTWLVAHALRQRLAGPGHMHPALHTLAQVSPGRSPGYGAPASGG